MFNWNIHISYQWFPERHCSLNHSLPLETEHFSSTQTNINLRQLSTAIKRKRWLAKEFGCQSYAVFLNELGVIMLLSYYF